MKIIRNNIIPIKGFTAINLFGIVFVRKEIQPQLNISMRNWNILLNHEYIHTAQMKEMLYLTFYIWYVIEWIVRLIAYRDARKAYRNISFEREAYDNQEDFEYYKKRNPYSFFKYVIKSNKMEKNR